MFEIKLIALGTDLAKAIKYLGSKSVNSLRLTELAAKIGSFKTPLQVTVPFTIPLYIQLLDSQLNEDFVKAMASLDSCAMWKMPLERDKVLTILNRIYALPTDLDPIVHEIQK